MSRLFLVVVLSCIAVAVADGSKSAHVENNPELVELLPHSENLTAPLGWVLYKQCDSAWGSKELGSCGSQSICSAGCAMSSVAMILSTRGWKGNPGTLNSWLDSNRGYEGGCDILWSDVDKLGYTKCMGAEKATYEECCTGVAAGHGVVINVRSGTHWVLVTGCDGKGNFKVNDPGFDDDSYSYSTVGEIVVYH
eukprot:TRINITY_DN3244_c0_g1_i1.p1 TRINITY_DN3244_c0_g1~~TRINITY_DN3244_c0_g1_i1.p1  ORF type:complete len:194 (-),score=40.90 TRINITY_DN3244_c0_g1_i1:112-693(-)